MAKQARDKKQRARKFLSEKRDARKDDRQRQCPSDDSQDSENVRKGKRPSRSNDPAWYAQTPALLRDAASIPFSRAAGVPFNLDFNLDFPNGQYTGGQEVTPGILTLAIVPSPALATVSSASALNVAATSLYSYVRHANSGSANYDAPDLMLYCLAMGQVYSYLNFLQRVYGTCQLYSNFNRFLPRAIVQAQGVDYDDLISNLANFRYGLNSLIHKASSLACPADMTYFRRLAFLFSGIYAEGESIKDQLYMYVPQGFMQFNATATNVGGGLQYVPFIGTTSSSGMTYKTVDQLISFGNSLLQPIISDEDMNIMSGDILKAYGANILKLQTVPEILQIVPTTDLNVLEQFQNANWFGIVPPEISVTQLADGRLSAYAGQTGGGRPQMNAATRRHLLTTILTEPGAPEVMERTRLMANYISEAGDPAASASTSQISCASEFATNLYITNLNAQGTVGITEIGMVQYINQDITAAAAGALVGTHCQLENFKFHPCVYYVRQTQTGPYYEYLGKALDLDNFTIIDSDTLDTINEAAMLSLFAVQSIAKAN